MQHYLDITDPDLCAIELDIFWAHVAQHQWRWRYDENGDRVEDIFDPLAMVASAAEALCAVPRQGRGPDCASPPASVTATTSCPFGDASSDIDFETFFKNQGAKGFHNPNYEQDNAPGGSGDPGQLAPVHQVQRLQHGQPARLTPTAPHHEQLTRTARLPAVRAASRRRTGGGYALPTPPHLPEWRRFSMRKAIGIASSRRARRFDPVRPGGAHRAARRQTAVRGVRLHPGRTDRPLQR